MPGVITSASDVLARVQELAAADVEVEKQLNRCRGHAVRTTAQDLQELRALEQATQSVADHAYGLADRISYVSESAARLAQKVRQLDDEQSRVTECINTVQVVQDVKGSLKALQTARDRQDWEAAGREYKRLRAYDPAVVSSPFAETIVPTSESPLPPTQFLQQAKGELLHEFLSRFATAVEAGDTININRFFRLFPDIDAQEAGLKAYADWAASAMSAPYASAPPTAGRSPQQLIASMSSLFENVASIVSQHQPIVKKYYGPGHMVTVIRLLVERCSKSCLEMLQELERQHSLASRAALARQIVHALHDDSTFSRITHLSEGRIEARQVDTALTELATVFGRWHLLRRFIWEHLEFDESSEDRQPVDGVKPAAGVQDDDAPAETGQVVNSTPFAEKVTQIMSGSYKDLDSWHVAFCTQLAHDQEEIDVVSSPVLSTSVDDAFHAFRRSLKRALSVGDVASFATACALIVRSTRIGLAARWRQAMELLAQDNIASRRDEDSASKPDPKVLACVLVNNMATASTYASRLASELEADIGQAFWLEDDLLQASSTLDLVRALPAQLHRDIEACMAVLAAVHVRPPLRPLLHDCYKNTSYVLGEEAYAEAQYRNELLRRFKTGWERIFSSLQVLLTSSNFELLFKSSLQHLARSWESILRTQKFNEFGALQFDRDLRSIVTFLATASSQPAALVRDAFARISNIGQVLLTDDLSELDDFDGQRLSSAEIQAFWQLRIDRRS